MVAKKYQKTNRTFIALCIKQAPIVRDVFFIIILLSLCLRHLPSVVIVKGVVVLSRSWHACTLSPLFLYNKCDKYLINYSMSLE